VGGGVVTGEAPGIELAPNYSATFGALVLDLVAILVLAYVVYFRRHGRRDLLMALVCFNVGLFVVVVALSSAQGTVGLALGLGLFGALSIIRLRSEELSYSEVAYFFSAMALAIIHGLWLRPHVLSAASSALLVATVYILDVGPQRKAERVGLVLDDVFPDHERLRREVERRLAADVVELSVDEIDYVRETTRLRARIARRSARESGPVTALPRLPVVPTKEAGS
jgi:hypothetical protein